VLCLYTIHLNILQLVSIKLHNLIVIADFNAYTAHAERISLKYIQSALISYRVTRTFDVLTFVSNIKAYYVRFNCSENVRSTNN